MSITLGFTYDKVTPESAEQGDYSDSGWYREAEEWSIGKLKDALREAKSLGIVEPSCSHISRGTWFSSLGEDVDYRTGESTTYSLHIANVSHATMARIARVLRGKPVF